jgi:propionyl-CoA synthetase
LIEWYKKPEKTLERNEPFDRWYVGGQVNASFNCIDQHVLTGFANQTAIIHDSPLTSSTEKITYKQLQDEVSRFYYLN